MKRRFILAAVLGVVGVATATADTSPQQDLKEFRALFKNKFPKVPLNEFSNGVYALDPAAREEWQAIEEFPPYEPGIEHGKELFGTPFANGKTYGSCFEHGGIGIRQNYPYFDTTSGKVITLELAINLCREKNGEKPLPYKKGDIADISAYMASASRGKPLNIVIPNDPRAREAYEQGKAFYYAKRGQLNMSCADCHVNYAGHHIRADLLSPELGHPTHFPVYRSAWGELGTLHRRFGGCNEQVRAAAFKPQSDEYRNLEYFVTYMSNGLPVNGPGARK